MVKPIIQVCGDPTVDWLSYRKRQEAEGPYLWPPFEPVPGVSIGSQAGGAALNAVFIKELLAEQAVVQGIMLDKELLINPCNPAVTKAWTIWGVYPDHKNKPNVFRLSEWQGCETGNWDYAGNRLQGRTDLLIIEDTGLGFRDNQAGWPKALTNPAESAQLSHILLKLTQFSPGDHHGKNVENINPLIQTIIHKGLATRTSLLIAVKDLRSCPVRIGTSLSWEQLFTDIVRAIRNEACGFVEPGTPNLLFQRIIVTIGTSGAVIVEPNRNILIFDRSGQEDDFQRRYSGQMMGYNTCALGAFTAAWSLEGGNVDWEKAVKDGITLARYLHLTGYQSVASQERAYLQFPSRSLAEVYHTLQSREKKPDELALAADLGCYVDNWGTVNSQKNWTILEDAIKNRCNQHTHKVNAACQIAQDIVLRGPLKALENVPIETIGFWRSADRQEIEGVRSVYNAMDSYLRGDKKETPLSVAVFGPPGAGKSFAVKQIAERMGIKKEAQLIFNLSQFETPDDLIRAFHQIRDLHVTGNTPLVFWDEFDTPFGGKPLGWLRYFLAPMQDGSFTEKGVVHPVGGGIYVFAGATRWSFRDFCAGNSMEEREAKKTDFISRLRAFINVLGPNGNPNSIEDPLFIVRRAFLLNHALNTFAKGTKHNGSLMIEPGLLDAFLRVTQYKHGARSIETVIRMSNLAGRRKFELSALPPDHLLRMHVNPEEFLALAEKGHRELLRVGITGHIGLDPDKMDDIEKGIETAIRLIQAKFPERYLSVFSPLARGSDRIVARKLLAEDAVLIAVLPVSAEDYLNDFGSTDSHLEKDNYEGAELRQEFRYWMAEKAIEVIEMPPVATRNEAYEKAGFFIAEHSDVMIAVWDGHEAQGRGGTADIVRKALELKKPLCHIWAGNYKEDERKRTQPLEKAGTVRYFNFPG